MSLDELFFALMRRSGMSNVVASVYAALLRLGAQSMESLRRGTGEMEGDVDAALELLQEMRLIGRDRTRFYATEPRLAWLALVVDKIWRSQTTLVEVHELETAELPKHAALRELYLQIASEAAIVYQPYDAVRQHRELDVDTIEELSFFTCEAVRHAQREVVAVSRSPRSPQVAQFWTVLTDRLSRHAVQYRRVADLDEVEAHGLTIVRRDITDYRIDLRIIDASVIKDQFYAVDGKVLVVAHKAGQENGRQRRGVGRVTTYLDIVKRYRKRFDAYAMRGIPAAYVVQCLARAGEILVARARVDLEPLMVSWLTELIEYGKFTTFHVSERWPQDKRRSVEEAAIRAGVARYNPFGELVPFYGVAWDSIRKAYDEDVQRTFKSEAE
ncbi:MAG: hypothetical protein U1E73_09845 [Planctomycetota bacterium]